MEWKITRKEKTFKKSEIIRLVQNTFLLLAFFAGPFHSLAQSGNTITGDDCIIFDGCPEDQNLCADTVIQDEFGNDILGTYVDWTTPIVSQSCMTGGQTGNFQMLFELNEQLLTEECWDFNYISRVGTDGGYLKLFSGSDDDRSNNSVVITPYLILKDNAETSFDVKYAKPAKGDDYEYYLQLFIVDENGNEYVSGPKQQIVQNQKTYTFYTNNPNDQEGVFRLKYVFSYVGDKPSNANTGDTLISVDGILNDDGCSAGIDFVVSGPEKGFYPVGTHDLEYVATYTSPTGVVQSKTCSFTITVGNLVAQISGNEELNCSNTELQLSASETGLMGSASYLWNTGETTSSIEVSTPGDYTVTVTDSFNGCSDDHTVSVTQNLDTPTASISGNEELNCETTSITLDATTTGNVSYLWNTG
ncbi:MAG: hypothetical protein R3214_12115, partial [Christiangramia sp.]|nr:hypothetical protein [Christiangramia sp.]